MAAQLINNPLKFVSADVSASVVFTNRMNIVQVEFAQYGTATDVCEIQNRFGQIVWAGDGRDNLDTIRSGRIGWVEGLIVPVLTSEGVPNLPTGRLLIYFE